MKKLIGFWGFPNPKVMQEYTRKHDEYEFCDLCVEYGAPKSAVIPEANCKIIANILDNAIFFKDKLECIVASVGKEKCDSGRYIAKILKDMGFSIIESKYESYADGEILTPISTSGLSVREKITRITTNIIKEDFETYTYCEPVMGFWGVPPNDFSFLDLLPDATHLFGWVRCVEAKRPADEELELMVDENLPTVFFSQTFCSKNQIAKYLAKKHSGLFIDVDDTANNSAKAKIEAFIRLG
ncbi:MAG: hypothetical protein PHX18_04520 [Candidatus Gastranaerophilales bacterium]|nr:hypothetical protein [Candidatus Gastranaerophilales bacterium]